MIKKLLLSLVILAAATTSGVFGTHALLADTATLGASTYSTGSVDLKIKTAEAGEYADTVVGFSGVTINPGSSVTHTIFLKNASLTDTFKISGLATDVDGTIDPSKVKVKFVKHDSDPSVATTNSALSTWASSAKTFGTSFTVPAGDEEQYDMVVSLDSTAPTGSFKFSFVFTGENVAP